MLSSLLPEEEERCSGCCFGYPKPLQPVTTIDMEGSTPLLLRLKAVYGNVLKTLKSDSSSLKMVQKLMISSVGERDYSAQETCHLLMGLPMYRTSRDFVILSLDGSRQVDKIRKRAPLL